MGLEVVEIVMELEDEFGVRIPDSDASTVYTVADLAACVIASLQRRTTVCPSIQAFRRLQRTIVAETKLPPQQVRPHTRLEALYTSGNSDILWKIAECDSELPRRIHPPPGRDPNYLSHGETIGIIIGFGVIVASLHFGYFAWTAVVMLLGVLILARFNYAGASDEVVPVIPVPQDFPSSYKTVGDLVRRMVQYQNPTRYHNLDSDAKLIFEQDVVQRTRRIVADVMGLPLERVQPHSELVKDLNAG